MCVRAHTCARDASQAANLLGRPLKWEVDGDTSCEKTRKIVRVRAYQRWQGVCVCLLTGDERWQGVSLDEGRWRLQGFRAVQLDPSSVAEESGQ